MHECAPDLVVDPALVRKYHVGGPRYTSYPTADRFVEAFGADQYCNWLGKRNIGGISQPLSLYLHLPFCANVCYYCACNKIVTRDRSQSAKYIKYLAVEMRLVAERLGNERAIGQVHWGGGTPNFLAIEEMHSLMRAIEARFEPMSGAEYSIEIDPRGLEPGLLAALADLGFNRISIGVQDFDRAVQEAIHRVQGEDETRRAVEEARAHGFASVNFDLIYGLPKQTPEGFDATLDKVIVLSPDRIALYSYAHLPALFKPQRRIREADLPTAERKLQLLTLAIDRLTRAGYAYIGMDHFARPGDDLAVAQRQGRLTRNFMGYQTQGDGDLLGFGVSAIGKIGPAYVQNVKALEDYYARLDDGQLPVLRGLELNPDDLVRRAVIQGLICHFRLSIDSIETAYLVDFRKYFALELEALAPFVSDGLVELSPEAIVVTPRGRLLVRAICMQFDRYLRESRRSAGYSKVI